MISGDLILQEAWGYVKKIRGAVLVRCLQNKKYVPINSIDRLTVAWAVHIDWAYKLCIEI